jgi:PPOX class probable F420-dependent enzyme
MTLEALPAWAAAELLEARVARLAFADERDRPRVLPVTFAIAAGAAWTAIDRKPKRTAEPARVRRLRERPAAALCVDHYSDDWSELTWVQLLGAVEVLAVADAEPGLRALRRKYAQYRDRPPPGPVLRLEIERALSWRAADG